MHIFLAVLFTASVLIVSSASATSSRPFLTARPIKGVDAATLTVDNALIESLLSQPEAQQFEIPLSGMETVTLALEPFNVVSPDAIIPVEGRDVPDPGNDISVALYRGTVAGVPGSRAYIAFSSSGLINGYVVIPGKPTAYIATAAASFRAGKPVVTITRRPGGSVVADGGELCGTEFLMPEGDLPRAAPEAATSINEAGGMRIARVAIAADRLFVALFGNATAAQEYAIQLLGAVSDVYMRDLNVKIMLVYLHLWPFGGEPFSSDDFYSYEDWVEANFSAQGANLIHMFSSRSDLPYIGLAYIGRTCTYGNVGAEFFLQGSLPLPVTSPGPHNHDLYLTAHEMGHGVGSNHTHAYEPPIDSCGMGNIPDRGTIMSYCDNVPGGGLNVDMRFHRRAQEVIETMIATEDCFWYDCNGNDIADSVDITEATSPDVNSNGIPDECEDCNGNEVLDPDEISGGAPDINSNGVLDECESDCNSNGIPDTWEVTSNPSLDANGDMIPDECAPDCNTNGLADHVEIDLWWNSGTDIDLNRNWSPDGCEDCNANYSPDWADIDLQYNTYFVNTDDDIAEYLGESGVPIEDLGHSILLDDPKDVAVGPDRKLYITSSGTDGIVRYNPLARGFEDFVPTGTGGLDGPTVLILQEAANQILVACGPTNSVLRFQLSDGAFVDTFVTPGLGGLNQPVAMLFGPNGNLYVAGEDNTVREYSGVDGSYVGEVVSAGAGGLASPRGLLFLPNGNLIVTSQGSQALLEYDASSSTFVGQFDWNGRELNSPSDLQYGPDGNILVISGQGAIRIYEPDGRFAGLRIINRAAAFEATAFAIMPPSTNDCNGNWQPDECDISTGFSLDVNTNSIPDECEVTDTDGDGVPDSLDNCVNVANAGQGDDDSDDVGNACDLCAGYDDALDSDNDGTPDGCDVCDGYGDYADADSDGVPDGCDACEGFDDAVDSDIDGVPDDCDRCEGYSDTEDADQDGIPDGCDTCYACTGTITLDHVDGLHNTDTILTGIPVTFHFRLRTHQSGEHLGRFNHSIRLYSPDGAEWMSAGIDSAAIDWWSQFSGTDPGFTITQPAEPGAPGDTLQISGGDKFGPGLSEAFDEIAFTVTTLIDHTEAGKTLCLDSSSVDWLWHWTSFLPNSFEPFWEGPYCFTIKASTCCVGSTGNIDGDTGELVDIGDLTALITYLYIPPNPEPICMAEANIDGDAEGLIDIGDLTALISYLYIPPNPEPADCE
jgi:hypothetical protein